MDSITKIASLKTPDQFRNHVESLGIELPLDDEVAVGNDSPLLQSVIWNGRSIGNRIAVQPMEGWDGTPTGGVTDPMIRRWRRFGESGAKLIWGGEAMAVRPDGRANPNQLILVEQNRDGIRSLLRGLQQEHLKRYGATDDLVVGFQLTHSGRFCRPNNKSWEPRVAYRHPLLDAKFCVTSDAQVLSTHEVAELIEDYVRAAKLAYEIGSDFVDIKCCHGYLLHEFLSARLREDQYGGGFENRVRLPLMIVEAIRDAVPNLGIGVRLSSIDTVPYEPDPATAVDGKLGQGRPVEFRHLLPYRCGFGMSESSPLESDLSEPIEFVRSLQSRGVNLINLSAGSPYYTPHLLRPAAYPPSDGYQPHEDPLRSVARHIVATRTLKKAIPEVLFVGSGYSYLQEYLPHVAQHNIRVGWTDFVGIGRTVLSYPQVLMDAALLGKSNRKLICRTFSDCTTGPRNGLPSGCYPLDEYYKDTEDAKVLKQLRP